MDEPTTALTWEETLQLFEIINALKQQNVTIIYISHRMDEIFRIADRVTVLRDGKLVDSVPLAETNRTKIISMMTGKEIRGNSDGSYRARVEASTAPVLRVDQVVTVIWSGTFPLPFTRTRCWESRVWWALAGPNCPNDFWRGQKVAGHVYLASKEVKISLLHKRFRTGWAISAKTAKRKD